MRTPHFGLDGTLVEEVDSASLNTWRESGDWVALDNITSRGSTQKVGDWRFGYHDFIRHRVSTHTPDALTEYLRKYKTVPYEV